MSSLSMLEAKLPAGFRFHPRDEELVCDYLMKKIAGSSNYDQPPQLPILIQVDLNNCEPWDIPDAACVGRKEWYFYSKRDRKYATGLRTNRATISGYWKATGKDREVMKKGYLVGMRKTLVFYQGRAPKGTKTNWVMHEFRLHGISPPPKDDIDWVLCRVFHKKKEDSSEANNKQLMEMSSGSFTHSQDDDDNKNYSSSSYLPPFMEQPYITFHQSQLPNHLDQDQKTRPIVSQNNLLLSSTNSIIENDNFYIPSSPSFGKYLSELLFTEQYTNP